MFKLDTILGKFIKYTLLLLIVPPSIFLTFYFYSLRKDVIADAYSDISDEVTNQQTAISGWLTQKWVHFFGPVSGKTKVDSFIGYAAHLGLIRGGTPSGLYC